MKKQQHNVAWRWTDNNATQFNIRYRGRDAHRSSSHHCHSHCCDHCSHAYVPPSGGAQPLAVMLAFCCRKTVDFLAIYYYKDDKIVMRLYTWSRLDLYRCLFNCVSCIR